VCIAGFAIALPIPIETRYTLVYAISALFWLILAIGATIYGTRTLKHLVHTRGPAHYGGYPADHQQHSPYGVDAPNHQHGHHHGGRASRLSASASSVDGEEESVDWADATNVNTSISKAAIRLLRVVRLGQLTTIFLIIQVLILLESFASLGAIEYDTRGWVDGK
jgi:hypothetical protein